MRVPTTDEMDSTTAEERPKLVGMCADCGNWHKFNDKTDKRICSCGGHLIGSTIHSQRTFNDERAKKESAKYKRKMGIR